jgi:1-phosphofructokinase
MNEYTIITVGISPSWDIACFAADYQWGRHQVIERQTVTPAGKALNVSRALDALGRRSIAAGLWGQDDLPTALAGLRDCPKIKPRFTAVPGQTRRNITLIDTGRRREMHLRSPNPLASPQNLRRLTRDLTAMARPQTICVFAGAVPDEAVEDFVRMVRACQTRGANIVVDTSGPALDAVLDEGLSMIKPNVEELGELLKQPIDNQPCEIRTAARKLTDRVDLVVVSRGQHGAMALTDLSETIQRVPKVQAVCHTVGCGDYLLAGFLDGYLSVCPAIEPGQPNRAAIQKGLSRGVRLATKHATGRGKAKP